MNLINLSGKQIRVFSQQSCVQTKKRIELIDIFQEPILELEPSGLLRPYSNIEEKAVNGAPVVVQNYYAVDNPAGYIDQSTDGVIVTNLYASVARSLGLLDVQLFTVYRLVFAPSSGSSRSNVVGCLGFESK